MEARKESVKMENPEQNVTESIQSRNENSENVSEKTGNVTAVVEGTINIDFDNLTEEKVLAMTEFEITALKESLDKDDEKASKIKDYLKTRAWQEFKAKITWANFKTLISSAWTKLKSWLSNLDPIFRYAIYALILAKLFKLILGDCIERVMVLLLKNHNHNISCYFNGRRFNLLWLQLLQAYRRTLGQGHNAHTGTSIRSFYPETKIINQSAERRVTASADKKSC